MGLVWGRVAVRSCVAAWTATLVAGSTACQGSVGVEMGAVARMEDEKKVLPAERTSFGQGLKQTNGVWTADWKGDAPQQQRVTFVEHAPRDNRAQDYVPLYAIYRCDGGSCAGVSSLINAALPKNTPGAFTPQVESESRFFTVWWSYATGQWPTQHTPEISGGPEYRPSAGQASGDTTAVFAELREEPSNLRHVCVFLLPPPPAKGWPQDAGACVSVRVTDRATNESHEMTMSKSDERQPSPWIFSIVYDAAGVRVRVDGPRRLDRTKEPDRFFIAWLDTLRDQVGTKRKLEEPAYK